MNNKAANIIDLDGLKPKQIEQLQAIVAQFKQQNQQEATVDRDQENNELDSLNELFFESEIVQPFNRTMLYGERR